METNRKKSNMNELLFENRNKTYGAYAIRTTYNNSVLYGLLISLTFILLAAGAPKFFRNMFSTGPEVVEKTDTVIFIGDPTIVPKIEQVKAIKTIKVKKSNPDLAFTPSDTTSSKLDSLLAMNTNPGPGDPNGDTTGTNLPFLGGGGGGGGNPPEPKKDTVLVPDVDPQYPGGLAALQKFLKNNIKYPQRAIEDGV